MPFQIHDVDSNRPFCELVSCPQFFDTGEEAQAMAKTLSGQYGRKLRVKRVLDTHWMDREHRKMRDGTYTPVPWSHEAWWNEPPVMAIHRLHFPHASQSEPGKLAYTESPE